VGAEHAAFRKLTKLIPMPEPNPAGGEAVLRNNSQLSKSRRVRRRLLQQIDARATPPRATANNVQPAVIT
jgi:hypothetical protein